MSSIIRILREQRATRDGEIVAFGSLAQLLAAIFLLWQAWLHFPSDETDHLLVQGLFHLVTPLALVWTFVEYGEPLGFRRSALLTMLLLLVAAAPFLLTTGVVG